MSYSIVVASFRFQHVSDFLHVLPGEDTSVAQAQGWFGDLAAGQQITDLVRPSWDQPGDFPQQEEGVGFLTERLREFEPRLSDTQKALYLSAISVLRAQHANDVLLLLALRMFATPSACWIGPSSFRTETSLS